MAKRPISIIAAERAAKDSIIRDARRLAKQLPRLRAELSKLERRSTEAREKRQELTEAEYRELGEKHAAVTMASRAASLLDESSNTKGNR